MNCRAFELSLAHHAFDRLSPAERADFEEHAATCAGCGPVFEAYLRSTCAWVADFLADYLEGRSASDEARVFEWHLSACEECRTYLRQYQSTMRVARAMCGDELTLPQRLIAAVLSARPR